MTVAAVRTALKTRLETISGLTVHKHPPDTLAQLPAAFIDWEEDAAKYMNPNGLTIWKFRIYLLLDKQDSEAGYNELDDYVERAGTNSIKAAVEGGTVGDYVVVTHCQRPGGIPWRGQTFFGAEFLVEVGDTYAAGRA